ncbi:hypothetical protein DAPPUDRAFT_332255 [Daphnia pulex]|uniref:Uncharacterized protein n=1 Tax=Daphnia pulex TaxID=6669 RepID=E9HPF5_DAPPU|nr:hypothetical protein DAPPUDRAFT_332255 [Daphnia pulex]|eukprot:EFX66373.1 hypothetical protein DAPPUDRAFT_332255 [Daphnia pulex]
MSDQTHQVMFVELEEVETALNWPQMLAQVIHINRTICIWLILLGKVVVITLWVIWEFNQKGLQRYTFKCHSRQEICSSNLHSTHFFRQPVDNQLKKKEALALVDYSAIAIELGKSIQQHSLQQQQISCASLDLLPLTKNVHRYFIDCREDSVEIEAETQEIDRQAPYLLKHGSSFHVVAGKAPFICAQESTEKNLP